jgi:hypothetical protein
MISFQAAFLSLPPSSTDSPVKLRFNGFRSIILRGLDAMITPLSAAEEGLRLGIVDAPLIEDCDGNRDKLDPRLGVEGVAERLTLDREEVRESMTEAGLGDDGVRSCS